MITLQEKYQKAKSEGYSDEEITEYLGKKDPSFTQKLEKAQEAGYKPEEIINYFNTPKNKQFGAADYAKDIGQQTAQGIGIGALGTYGDLLQMLGLQPKEQTETEKAKFGKEFEALEKMREPGKPKFGETFSNLSELSEEAHPRLSRLPTSQDIETLGKKIGLVTEAETAAGRYGKRIGKMGAGMALTGPTNLKAPILAGLAGQTIEEAGGPPWMQALAEIAVSIKSLPASSAKNITSKTPEVEQTIQNLRKAGYTEQDITLAKNALEEHKILKKYATLTPDAENAINKGIKNSEELFKGEVKKGLPGYAEGGLPYLEKQASNVYSTMEDVASSVSIKNKEPVRKSIENAISYLEKYPLLDEQKKFIEFMKDGLNKLDKADTAEFFTGFYRNLGKAGNWGNRTQKEHLLGMVQKGIKETFEQSGPEAKKFGQYFEKTNEAWKKWLDAKELMGTLEKTQTVNGVDFGKLAKTLNDPENVNLAKKVLGPEQVKNIESIIKGANAIESLITQIPKGGSQIKELKYLEGVRSLFTGDYRPLAALIGMDAAKALATKMLIDPSKQNLMIKIIDAAKNNSPQQAAILSQRIIDESKDSSQAKEVKSKHR